MLQPGRQSHPPSRLHDPFTHVQFDDAVPLDGVKRQMPDPDVPSSQVELHFEGQGLHDGPKCPVAQDSHWVPVNPGRHVHTGEDGLQVPPEEHGGVQPDD